MSRQAGVVPTPPSVTSLSTLASTGTVGTIQGEFSTCEDSDFEIEPDAPDWRHTISKEELGKLKAKEFKRQDVINGK